MPLLLLLLLLLQSLLAATAAAAGGGGRSHFLRRHPTTFNTTGPAQYFELTRPLPTDGLAPACTAALLSHSFAYTYGLPPASATYSPPDLCPGPWDSVVLEFSAACRGEQYDRIAAVWLDGAELLRTSTAEPTGDGVFWVVRKEVSAYTALLRRPNATISVMLENIVDDVYTGIYHVNVSMLYYAGKNGSSSESDAKIWVFDGNVEGGDKLGFSEVGSRKLGGSILEEKGGDGEYEKSDLVNLMRENVLKARELGYSSNVVDDSIERLNIAGYEMRGSNIWCQDGDETRLRRSVLSKKPADLIIPISSNGSDDGFWFRIQNATDIHSKIVDSIPSNTHKALLEIYVSFHSYDEFWYSNPPDSYILQNNLTAGGSNGAFRRVYALIDGIYVGSVVPFPVVFTGGINPLFWEPVVGIGAFDLPTYNLDLTPFLGLMLDGKPHTFGLGVTDGVQFWLVDANLHLWLDHGSSQVQSVLVQYTAPEFQVSRKYKIQGLDAEFKTQAKQQTQFAGWVNSSYGNFTTHIIHEFKFKNKIKIKKNGSVKKVEQEVEAKTELRLEAYSVLLFAQLKRTTDYDLELETSTLPQENYTELMTTSLSNGMEHMSTLVLPAGIFSNSLVNSQEAEGWMLVQDHSVLSGSSTTEQTYNYTDDPSSYARKVVASGGTLLTDNTTFLCLTSAQSNAESR